MNTWSTHAFKLLRIAAVGFSIILAHACTMSASKVTLTSEIQRAAAGRKSASVDISGVVARYIQAGDDKAAVLQLLATEGFDTSPAQCAEEGSESAVGRCIATRRVGAKFSGTGDEIRIFLSFNGNRMNNAGGIVMLMAP